MANSCSDGMRLLRRFDEIVYESQSGEPPSFSKKTTNPTTSDPDPDVFFADLWNSFTDLDI